MRRPNSPRRRRCLPPSRTTTPLSPRRSRRRESELPIDVATRLECLGRRLRRTIPLACDRVPGAPTGRPCPSRPVAPLPPRARPQSRPRCAPIGAALRRTTRTRSCGVGAGGVARVKSGILEHWPDPGCSYHPPVSSETSLRTNVGGREAVVSEPTQGHAPNCSGRERPGTLFPNPERVPKHDRIRYTAI